ncbi:MAG: GNAT family N-acetyltransferase, partial [Proteobacteria bacterium]|nr:GNAT family N-acetyltransferase [Pseudomonadota bacterium]
MKLETERLFIYPIDDDALKTLIEKEADAELKQAYTEMLQGCIEHSEQRIWYTVWAMEHKSEPGTIVGDLSFKGLNADGMVEIGYGLKDDFRGNGYMTEAVRAICQWAVEQDGVTRIEAETTAENRDSQSVLAHSGFIPLGVCGEEGPRFLYTNEGNYMTGYKFDGYRVLERTPTGSGYDLKLKVSVDGEIRYLYYAEMPDRCYIRGWSFYEISESNYDN